MNVGLDVNEAVKFLAIVLPVTKNQLKRAYHRRSLQEHPDHSRHPQAEVRFAKLTQAYELLVNHTDAFLETGDSNAVCDDGTKLSKLGKGLGPTTNGMECPECRGRGFRKHATGRNPCMDCFTLGVQPVGCTKCNRTGVFVVNGKLKGKCFECDGRGSRKRACLSCKGAGFTGSTGVVYAKCNKCEGCGEIPMWNPVLPRGLLL